MKRWLANIAKKGLAGIAVAGVTLGILSGCGGRNTFLTKEVYQDAHTNQLPAKLDEDSTPLVEPVTPMSKTPATVNFPDRPQRHLTLQEAIALALENGTASGRAGIGRGLVDDTQATFSGPGTLNSQSDKIRVLSMNPALAGAAMEASLARFDAVWVTSMNWTNTDNLQQGLASFNNGSGANFSSSIIKAFASGGVANVSLIGGYQNLNTPPTGAFSVLNPQYTSRLSFGFEQPLWRDFGTEINQLLPRLPSVTGQSLTNNLAASGYNNHQGAINGFLLGAAEGIIISKLRFDQNRAEFERNVHVLMVNTEVAYWNLYNKYGQLYSFEENLRILRRALQLSESRQKAGTEKPVDYYQTRAQFQEFRGERIRALQEVLEAERNLRGILGLPTEDGERLVPITPPTLAELNPNWDACLHDALNSRPELVLARENLRYHQYILTVQKNQLKPDMRFYGKFEPVGFGSTLQGNDQFIDGTGTARTTNSFRSLASGDFVDYQFGVSVNVPLGFRYENAAVRAARLQLTQAFHFLRDQEDRTTRYLTNQYQELARWHKLIEVNRAERMGYEEAIKKFLEKAKGGNELVGGAQSLEIQRRYASAFVKEYNAISEYNNTIARLEWAKGTILRHNNVHISEGPLPQGVQRRATEVEKERSAALVLCERPDSLTQPGRMIAGREQELRNWEPPTNLVEHVTQPIGVVPQPNGNPDRKEWLPVMPRMFDQKFAPQPAPETKAQPTSLPGRPVNPTDPFGPALMLPTSRAPAAEPNSSDATTVQFRAAKDATATESGMRRGVVVTTEGPAPAETFTPMIRQADWLPTSPAPNR